MQHSILLHNVVPSKYKVKQSNDIQVLVDFEIKTTGNRLCSSLNRTGNFPWNVKQRFRASELFWTGVQRFAQIHLTNF